MAATSFLAASLVRIALSHPLLLTSSKLSCRRTLISFPLTPRLGSSASGICHLAQAIKGDVDGLLKGVADKTVIEEVKRVLEMARRASSRREVLHTNFLTPPVVKESMLALEKLADLKAVVQGGYPQAERCRISVGHPEVLTSDPDVIAALSITGNFGFQPCSHGDFLGAILGTGIAREKLGDIILQGEKGAQVIVVPELVDFIISSLDKVGNVPVSFSRMPLISLDYEPPRTKSFKTIEASVRVDAISSAGFKLSRTKLVDLIRDGDVRVNWTPVTKNGATLKTGDIVSVRGKGRLKIGEINPTKKGKFAVELILYLLKPRGVLPKIRRMLHRSLALFSFLIALAAIVYIVSNVGAFSTTEKLSKLALIPTLPAVIPISENIDTQSLAATEKTSPFVR